MSYRIVFLSWMVFYEQWSPHFTIFARIIRENKLFVQINHLTNFWDIITVEGGSNWVSQNLSLKCSISFEIRLTYLFFFQRDRITLKIEIPHTEHSKIIGRRGKNTQDIMRETMCHIHFPDSNKNHDMEKNNQVIAFFVNSSTLRNNEALFVTSRNLITGEHYKLCFYTDVCWAAISATALSSLGWRKRVVLIMAVVVLSLGNGPKTINKSRPRTAIKSSWRLPKEALK